MTAQEMLEMAAAFEQSFHNQKIVAQPGPPERLQIERLIGVVLLVGASICARLDALATEKTSWPIEDAAQPPN